MLASGLAFLFHAWDGKKLGMHNLMDYGRHWLDDPHGATMLDGQPGRLVQS
jgi:hypothetical protein